jgi:hypothetical protein
MHKAMNDEDDFAVYRPEPHFSSFVMLAGNYIHTDWLTAVSVAAAGYLAVSLFCVCVYF